MFHFSDRCPCNLCSVRLGESAKLHDDAGFGRKAVDDVPRRKFSLITGQLLPFAGITLFKFRGFVLRHSPDNAYWNDVGP
jgi:hypothetical protein